MQRQNFNRIILIFIIYLLAKYNWYAVILFSADSCGGAVLGRAVGSGGLRSLAMDGNPLSTEGVCSLIQGAAEGNLLIL